MSSHENFRSSVLQSACVVGVFLVGGPKFFGEAKIGQLDKTLPADEDVVGLEILDKAMVTL